MQHDHSHATHDKALKIALAIAFLFMIIEVVGGLIANSLALISDALHMFTDIGALFMSLIIVQIARRPHTPQMSFGYHRAEILGALASALTLWALSAVLIYEAVNRFLNPLPVQGPVVFVIATLGLIANLLMMKVLHPSQGHNLNIRAAYVHVLGDLLGSIGVILSGIIIWLTGWMPVDPIITVLMALALLYQATGIIKKTVRILMQSTPEHLDPTAIEADLLAIEGVTEVHDLHIWSVTPLRIALSAHVISTSPSTLQKAHELIEKKYNIRHMTLQVEDPKEFQSRYCYDCQNKT